MAKEKRYFYLTIKQLWIGFSVILIATLIAEYFVHLHGVFTLDSLPLFNAWYGFISCAAIVLISKLLGLWLKRPEDYYKKHSQ